ncbi:hypothetical protein AYO44_05500 [Planctomycetaceae bacterium SCGC AG-212-F19]|nr:hypothetical protein AYO44_05500 [Planctomycetaceae bacterium SCGC AG-212-F19]
MPKGKTATKKLNKMDAMRQTVAKLGKDASAKDLQDHLKKDHGVDMSTEMVYTYKANVVRELGGKRKGKRRGPKPGKKAPVSNGAGGITMQDIEAVKAIVDRLGAEKVSQLAGVLS